MFQIATTSNRTHRFHPCRSCPSGAVSGSVISGGHGTAEETANDYDDEICVTKADVMFGVSSSPGTGLEPLRIMFRGLCLSLSRSRARFPLMCAPLDKPSTVPRCNEGRHGLRKAVTPPDESEHRNPRNATAISPLKPPEGRAPMFFLGTEAPDLLPTTAVPTSQPIDMLRSAASYRDVSCDEGKSLLPPCP